MCMKTADTGTDLQGCAANLEVTMVLTLLIVAEHSYLQWKALWESDLCKLSWSSFSFMHRITLTELVSSRLELNNNKVECPFIKNSSPTTWKALQIPDGSMTVGSWIDRTFSFYRFGVNLMYGSFRKAEYK